MFSEERYYSDNHAFYSNPYSTTETHNILWVMMTFQKHPRQLYLVVTHTVQWLQHAARTADKNRSANFPRSSPEILFQRHKFIFKMCPDQLVPRQHGRWSTSWKVTGWFWSQCVQSKCKACWMSSHLTMQHDEPSGQSKSSHNYLESLYLLARCRSDRCFCLQLYCCYGTLSLWIISHHNLHIRLLKPSFPDCKVIFCHFLAWNRAGLHFCLMRGCSKIKYVGQIKLYAWQICCHINLGVQFLSPADTVGSIK